MFYLSFVVCFVVLWLSKETPQYEAWIIETSAATLAV